MCVFAAPMLVLYGLSIGVAYMVYPKKDQAPKEEKA
jgi:Sec-independent protein secretion pathway component TatC